MKSPWHLIHGLHEPEVPDRSARELRISDSRGQKIDGLALAAPPTAKKWQRTIAEMAHRVPMAVDYEALIGRAVGARFVFIGEASDGMHEFYEMRAELTRRLIVEKGIRVVALGADRPDSLNAHG